jgi:hypothetical protein
MPSQRIDPSTSSHNADVKVKDTAPVWQAAGSDHPTARNSATARRHADGVIRNVAVKRDTRGIKAWGHGAAVACRIVQALTKSVAPPPDATDAVHRAWTPTLDVSADLRLQKFVDVIAPLAKPAGVYPDAAERRRSSLAVSTQRPLLLVSTLIDLLRDADPGRDATAVAASDDLLGELEDLKKNIEAGGAQDTHAPGFYTVMAVIAGGSRIAELMNALNDPGNVIKEQVMHFPAIVDRLLKTMFPALENPVHRLQLTCMAEAALKVPFEFPQVREAMCASLASRLHECGRWASSREAKKMQEQLEQVLRGFLAVRTRRAIS